MMTAAQVWVEARVPRVEATEIYEQMFAALRSLPRVRALTVKTHLPPTPEGVEALPGLGLLRTLSVPRLTTLDLDVWLPARLGEV